VGKRPLPGGGPPSPVAAGQDFTCGPPARRPGGHAEHQARDAWPEDGLARAASAPETAIITPFTNNSYQTVGLEDWTDPLAGQTWTRHTVTAP
jgi:hypothetical protein